jgi:hypothetical protein
MPAESHADTGVRGDGVPRPGRLSGRRLDPGHRRDEAVPSARDRLDELRPPGVITERVTELGDSLRQCVVGDVGARPERVEQLLFRDEGPRVVEQVQQEVEELGRQFDDGVVPHDAVTGAIGEERAESVAGTCHVS